MKNKLLEELENYSSEFIKDDYAEIVPNIVYSCGYCGLTYAEEEMMKEHTKECLYNPDNDLSCITCQHCNYVLNPPYGKTNGYIELIKKGVTSKYGYFNCKHPKELYSGKLTENTVLKPNKKCYEPLSKGERFTTSRTSEYEEYLEIMNRIDVEEEKVNEWVDEYWDMVLKLNQGKITEQEFQLKIDEILGDDSNDKEH